MVVGSGTVVLAFLCQSLFSLASGASVDKSASDGDSCSLMQAQAALTRNSHHRPTFGAFIEKHGRDYAEGTPEYEARQELFEQQVRHVQNHNSRSDRRWTAGINHLADRTEAELAQLHGWRGVRARPAKSGQRSISPHSHVDFSLLQLKALPEEKSWAHLQAVHADVDQGGCGGCWAAAASVALNAGAEIKGVNRTFAAQDLICGVPNPHKCGGAGGCQGATVELAMHYAMEYGIKTEEEMPYKGSDKECARDLSVLQASFKEKLEDVIAIGTHRPATAHSPGPHLGFIGWERLPENNYESLMRAVAEHGPVAVSVSANEWYSYQGGIFDGCAKDAVIGHGVTLIGYGKQGTEKYWHIKNSWGLEWGEGGNIRLLRDDNEETEHCGTDYHPEEGVGCEGGPSKVKVCGMCAILYDAVVPFFTAPAAM